MPYNYTEVKPKIFTEENQVKFMKVRDTIKMYLKTSDAFQMSSVLSLVTGDVWTTMAFVDRLVELGEIREISEKGVAGQNRVFIKI